MKDDAGIRDLMGVSQEEFAAFLRVTKSHLSMVELNLRELPAKALVKLSAAELSLHKGSLTAELDVLYAQEQAETVQLLEKKRRECLYKAIITQKKLDTLKEQYQQCINGLRVWENMPALLPPENDNKLCAEWLEMIKDRALLKIKDCGRAQQQLLEMRIKALCNEAELINKMIDGDNS